MKYWIYSINEENWNVVKNKHVFAWYNKKITKKLNKGDEIIFYVTKTGMFKGIFKIDSTWYTADKPIWSNEKRKILYTYQCKLKKIVLGEVVFDELINNLIMKINKISPHLVLQTHITGPAYHGNPIPEEDYSMIFKKMTEHIPITPDDDVEPNHKETIIYLEQIGSVLGFDTYSERPEIQIAKGCEVDVIWQTRIANIGVIKYIFEVQHKGSIKSATSNLLQSINNPLVKKVIIVADKKQLLKSNDLIEQLNTIPNTTKSMFVYLDIKKVKTFSRLIDEINEFKEFFDFG